MSSVGDNTQFIKAKHNLDIDVANAQLGLLEKYLNTRYVSKKAAVAAQFHEKITSILQDGMSVSELMARIKRAIELDEYRPRDMSIFDFAISPDLAYVGGEFSTFDKELAELNRDANISPIKMQRIVQKKNK